MDLKSFDMHTIHWKIEDALASFLSGTSYHFGSVKYELLCGPETGFPQMMRIHLINVMPRGRAAKEA
jgi:hypothetical protein